MKHPECTNDPSECRIRSVSTGGPMLGWRPTYDGDGNRTDGGDPNWYSASQSRSTCKREWVETTHRGKVTVKAKP